MDEETTISDPNADPRPYLEIDFNQGAEVNSQSWLGGQPKLPVSVPWPTAGTQYGSAPLQFLAHISCADLPDNLWNGEGPRTGWLVFFRLFEDENGFDTIRVIHTSVLGPTRYPAEVPDNFGEGLRQCWPLKLVMPQTIDRNVPLDHVELHTSYRKDSENALYRPFDWPSAVAYVDTICANLETQYNKSFDEVRDKLLQGRESRGSFIQRLQYIRQERHVLGKRLEEVKRTINLDMFGRFRPSSGGGSLPIDMTDLARKFINRKTLLEEFNILFKPLSADKRRFLKQTKQSQAHRMATLTKTRQFPQRIRDLEASGLPFAVSSHDFFEEFQNTQFYLNRMPTMKSRSQVSLGSITEVGINEVSSMEEYTKFVFHHVADLYINNKPELANVPPRLLAHLHAKWTGNVYQPKLHLGEPPAWTQSDEYGLFDADERRRLIQLRDRRGNGSHQDPLGRFPDTVGHVKYDEDNVLLLQFPAQIMFSFYPGTAYFVMTREELAKGEFSKAIALVQSD